MSPAPFENPPADAEVPAALFRNPAKCHRRHLIGSLGHHPFPQETHYRGGGPWARSMASTRAQRSLGSIPPAAPLKFAAAPRMSIASARPRRGENPRLPTEVAILKSNSLLLSVARDRNLANDPAFMGPVGRYQNVDDPVVRQRVVGALQRDIQVGVIPKTDLVASAAPPGRRSSRRISSISWCRTISRTASSRERTPPNGWKASSRPSSMT